MGACTLFGGLDLNVGVGLQADYAVTFYAAECWNTVTSILITVHGVWGLWKHGWAETRSALAFFAMLVVGIGSTMFHATLWRSMQLMDELPMLWGNCVFMFQLYTMQIPRGRSTLKEFAGVAVFAVVATAAIILFDDDDQNIFLLCYGGGVVYVVYKGLKMDKLYNAKNVVLYEFALLFYGGGLLLWTLDRVYCSSVQRFHFHAIWHVCASTGTYLSVCTWVYLREAAMKGDPRVRGPFGFQYVEPGRAV